MPFQQESLINTTVQRGKLRLGEIPPIPGSLHVQDYHLSLEVAQSSVACWEAGLHYPSHPKLLAFPSLASFVLPFPSPFGTLKRRHSGLGLS